MSTKRPSPNEGKTQADHAREALEAKQQAEKENPPQHPESKTAHEGQLHEHERREDEEPPMGAFDAEGHRPVLERSRKVR